MNSFPAGACRIRVQKEGRKKILGPWAGSPGRGFSWHAKIFLGLCRAIYLHQGLRTQQLSSVKNEMPDLEDWHLLQSSSLGPEPVDVN